MMKPLLKTNLNVTEKIKRDILRNEDGSRVHKMNINMKNRILGDANWDTNKEFDGRTKHVLKLSENSHYIRMILELPRGETTKINVVENNNEENSMRANATYYVLSVKGIDYLVKSSKGMVEGFLKIVE